ncbi:MAG TPA: glycoside hydrolase family 99-like domain-containing protein [Candidatus Hydrogenedentes bacterium]|nr:glycoside hydrolase family 99-like domain-containing protein [Candidatus Hydrogenedentota bacterium]HPG67324.1 glycoside hydrolase family 99-like domain-containing protein [Candidatus Hydrogenedentota bacterium]
MSGKAQRRLKAEAVGVWMMIAALLASAEAPRERPAVGAIRWDAWHGSASDVGLTVEKTLAPKHWHYRLPFYGQEIGDTAVEARANTQATMDREIEYAHKAGLDYWAFVVYPEDDALSLGLKLYLSSEKKSLVRFCLNLQGGWEARGGPGSWPDRIDRYVPYFREPSYQTVLDHRPLVFLYSVEGLVGPGRFETWPAARDAFDQLRAAAKAAGVGDPYIVAQGWSPETLAGQADQLGLDAIGAYASSAGAKAGSYAALAAHTERWWDAFKATGREVVPLATAGWDMRPRIETPVPWVDGGDIERYYEAPRPEELGAHLEKAVQWCRANRDTAKAQAILIYAWNEFDEGGWICPTLSEGTARLDAIAIALRRSATSAGH